MKWSFATICFGLLVTGLCVGCTALQDRKVTFLPPEANDPALRAGFSFDQVVLARRLYQTRCARCHRFYNPWEYESYDWNLWTIKMSKKAHLSLADGELVSKYLINLRSSHETNAKPE
jgi:hypothetical protein